LRRWRVEKDVEEDVWNKGLAEVLF